MKIPGKARKRIATIRLLPLFAACLWPGWPAPASAEDWPQWRGPRQDGISQETGLLKEWPEDGPPVVWRRRLGGGYSCISIADGKGYTLFTGFSIFSDGDVEFVQCFDVETGDTIWAARSGREYVNHFGNGPRSTPTVHQGRVYVLGASGDLLCLDAASGKRLWGFNVLTKYGADNLQWGLAGSPYVEGGSVYINVGGSDGNSIIAFDKDTGAELWSSLDDQAGYATPLGVTVGGMRQLVFFTGIAVVSVVPEDGTELWRYSWTTDYGVNAAQPIFHNNRLFISSNYGFGGALLELSTAGSAPAVRELWKSKKMQNYFATSILIDGFLYGFHNTRLVCMDLAGATVRWSQTGFDRGSVTAADGKLIVLGEKGTLALADASPKAWREISRTEIFDSKCWTVPIVSNGRLFLRDEAEMVCLSLRP